MQKSFEDILKEKMAQPVSIKGKDGATMLPMEAMALSVMNNAMKGDISAIQFIRSTTQGKQEEDADQEQVMQHMKEVIDELCHALRADGFQPSNGAPEIELLAVELTTLRRVARMLMADGHQDIVVTPTRQDLSTTNRTYNDLQKLWLQHWREYRQQLLQAKMMRR